MKANIYGFINDITTRIAFLHFITNQKIDVNLFLRIDYLSLEILI